MTGGTRSGGLPRVWIGAALLLWTALVWFLLVSGQPPSLGWMPWRHFFVNLGHAPLFGVEAVLLAASWRRGRLAGVLVPACVAVLYGALIEWTQSTVPGRSASLLDVLTDAVGAFGMPWMLVPGSSFVARALPVAGAAVLAAWAATSATG